MEVPARVTEFLLSLGIDPRKPPEVYNVTGQLEKDDTIWYNGWYHVCGTVVGSPKTERVDDTYFRNHSYSPDPDFHFKVLPILDNALLHKEFPTPVIQLEIDTRLPYVLQTPFDG